MAAATASPQAACRQRLRQLQRQHQMPTIDAFIMTGDSMLRLTPYMSDQTLSARPPTDVRVGVARVARAADALQAIAMPTTTTAARPARRSCSQRSVSSASDTTKKLRRDADDGFHKQNIATKEAATVQTSNATNKQNNIDIIDNTSNLLQNFAGKSVPSQAYYCNNSSGTSTSCKAGAQIATSTTTAKPITPKKTKKNIEGEEKLERSQFRASSRLLLRKIALLRSRMDIEVANNNNNNNNNINNSQQPHQGTNATETCNYQNYLSKLYSHSEDACTGTGIEFKSGYLNKKRICDSHGKPSFKGRRAWKRVHVTIRDLLMFKHSTNNKDTMTATKNATNGMMAPSNRTDIVQTARPLELNKDVTNTPRKTSSALGRITPPTSASVIKLHHAFARKSASYLKKPNVFHLILADRSEYLLEADSEEEMNVWIESINFAAACLSPPQDSVREQKQRHQRANSKTMQQTKMIYWEQLVDHDERLQRLKTELDTHLTTAPVNKKATKKDRVQFIERVAFLKLEIERYDFYVECMRKKSNSEAAIILSKHPQIASFTPSSEMLK